MAISYGVVVACCVCDGFCVWYCCAGIASLQPAYGKATTFSFFILPSTIATVGVATLLVGFVSGIYPSLFLSSFNTIKVLKGATMSGSGGKDLLRSGLLCSSLQYHQRSSLPRLWFFSN
ncbi:MAG: hypothetical protein WDO15_10685 [Bacteroidota bacterium]